MEQKHALIIVSSLCNKIYVVKKNYFWHAQNIIKIIVKVRGGSYTSI